MIHAFNERKKFEIKVKKITYKWHQLIFIYNNLVLRHFVPRHVLLTLYRSLILPYISYGICVRGHAAETHLHKLLVLQKRALRPMFFTDPRTHAVPLFLETKQLPISFLMFEQMSLLMYDVHNNLAPDNIKNMFTKLIAVQLPD